MKVALFCNDDLTTNIIFAPVFDIPSIKVEAVFFASSPSKKQKSNIGGAFALLKKMAFPYWLYLVFTNGLYKAFEFLTLLLRLSPRSGVLVSLRRLAKIHNVPCEPISDFADPAFTERLKYMDIDLLLIRVGAILKPYVLDVPRTGTWCVHSSLLPGFKGIAGEFHALRTPAAAIGSTVFGVTPKLDEGPSLGQVAIARDENASVFDHMIRNNQAAADLLVDMLKGQAGHLHAPALPQSYYTWPTKAQLAELHAQGKCLMKCQEMLRLILNALRISA